MSLQQKTHPAKLQKNKVISPCELAGMGRGDSQRQGELREGDEATR